MRKFVGLLIFIVFILGFWGFFTAPKYADDQTSLNNNLISNASFEESTVVSGKTTPKLWFDGSYGKSTATLSYPVAGYNSQKAAKIAITKYTSGDRKWYFQDVNVKPNTTYVFSNYYKSNVVTEIDVRYTLTNNKFKYLDLLRPVSSPNDWKKAEVTFTTPSNVKSLTIFHLIDKKGELIVDEFNLHELNVSPTILPTSTPTIKPTTIATNTPNVTSTPKPTISATAVPTSIPTPVATSTPAVTQIPTSVPTSVPTVIPTATPVPSIVPTIAPTDSPIPTIVPTDLPTVVPTQVPTTLPTELPTVIPIATPVPSIVPTIAPTDSPIPTIVPTESPITTILPTNSPIPTLVPTLTPSATPEVTASPTPVATPTLTSTPISTNSPTPTPTSTPTPFDGGLILNASVENVGVNSALPQNWSNNSWGTNTPIFTYPVEGKESVKGLKVELTSYTDGDAKWWFDEVNVLPNTTYKFTNSYKSNVVSNITIQYRSTSNVLSYVWLASPDASNDWSTASYSFTTPSDVKSLTIFHIVSSVGWLITDNYNLVESSTNKFSQGMVSFNFDDGYLSVYQNAIPTLNNAGYKSTQYILSNTLNGGFSGYVTISEVLAMQAMGHEIGAHSDSHADLTLLSSQDLNNEVSGSKTILENAGVNFIKTFAYPYGNYNTAVIQALVNAGYEAGRGAYPDGENYKDTNKYELRVVDVQYLTPLETVKSWIDQAVAHKSWVILMFHQIDGSADQYSTTPSRFQEIVDYVQSKGVMVVTNKEGVALMNP